MREIRPIREEEAPAYLELLCEVFGLDYNRAEPIFFTEPLFDLNRKWALFEGREMVSIMTTVPLQFGDFRAVGIAGVATREARRQEGFAGALMKKVLDVSARNGETASLLFARQPELYARLGFAPLDDVIQGPLLSTRNLTHSPIELGALQDLYDGWAAADRMRLRRDEQRWTYWRWVYRDAYALDGGYACLENGQCREVIRTPGTPLSLGAGVEWFGLKSMADKLDLPLVSRLKTMSLMGRGIDVCPEMFLSDQF